MGTDFAQLFEDLFFSTEKVDTCSVGDYLREVSGGKISIGGEVVGPLSLPRSLSAYAHGNGGMTDDTPNAQTMALDALDAVKDRVSLDHYDNGHNGYVDAFIVVHAGWTIPDATLLNDIRVFAFLTIPEDANIGVAAHELGHLVFGWSDLYEMDYSFEGVENWCLMAGRAWGGSPPGVKPCHPSSWCKLNQGWADKVIDTHPKSITMAAVEDKKQVHRLWKDGDSMSQQYFLLDNREPIGFDQSLPGFGLLVWHIDDSQDDDHDERNYKVSLMQADGLNQLGNNSAGRVDFGDRFPGRTGNKESTYESFPSSRSYVGYDTKISITNISASAPTRTMNIAV